MELVIEWSEEELNLAAIRAVLREVTIDEAVEAQEREPRERSDLHSGLLG